ncbi:MAG: hypothetical protein K2Y39_12275 [Candidatus Obscuribacterales bacterium]|nr:hypothetical protein [Candidatus Obscuribacterales bacterium]
MRNFELEANLLATCAKHIVALSSSGKNGVLSLSNTHRPATAIMGMLPLSNCSRQNLLELHRGCTELGLSLSVEVCGRAVAQLGSRCRPGVFSRLLGVYPVEVRFLPVLYSLLSMAVSGKQ